MLKSKDSRHDKKNSFGRIIQELIFFNTVTYIHKH